MNQFVWTVTAENISFDTPSRSSRVRLATKWCSSMRVALGCMFDIAVVALKTPYSWFSYKLDVKILIKRQNVNAMGPIKQRKLTSEHGLFSGLTVPAFNDVRCKYTNSNMAISKYRNMAISNIPHKLAG